VRAVNAGDLRCFGDVRSYTERSAVSFFIASTARAFVGILASTMSNAIVLTRQLRGEANSSYYYDCTTERALLAPKYASHPRECAMHPWLHRPRQSGGGRPGNELTQLSERLT
jgi:hypothetical protein